MGGDERNEESGGGRDVYIGAVILAEMEHRSSAFGEGKEGDAQPSLGHTTVADGGGYVRIEEAPLLSATPSILLGRSST